MGLEENENEEMGQRQTVEAIGLDFRDGLLLLLLRQQPMIVWEAALGPGCLINKEKQQCFKTLKKKKTPILSPLTNNIL